MAEWYRRDRLSGAVMFLMKRVFQDILKNGYLSIITVITISLSIFIVSAVALFFLNINDVMNSWKKGLKIMVYLKHDVTGTQLPEIKRHLVRFYGIKSARFIPKEEALLFIKDSLPKKLSILEDLKENPLPDAFEIVMLPSYSSWKTIEHLAEKIKAMASVDEVEYGRQWFGRFRNIFNLFKLAGYAVGGLFFVAGVFIVANTIRLLLYSRRDEVEIMRLVGAKDNFIKIPFYIEGVVQGIAGGIIGLFILFITFVFISANIAEGFSPSYFSIRFLPFKIISVIILCSMFVGWLGSFLSLKQFFKT